MADDDNNENTTAWLVVGRANETSKILTTGVFDFGISLLAEFGWSCFFFFFTILCFLEYSGILYPIILVRTPVGLVSGFPHSISLVYIEMTFAASPAAASHSEFYSLHLLLTISYYTSLFVSFLLFPLVR